MRTDLAALDLSLRRRSLLAYTLGMALYTFVIVALYPTFRNESSLNSLTEGNNAAAALFGITGSLTSPAGWLDANIFGNFLPLIMLLLAIGYGASAVAGQDEDGMLALLAVLPQHRDALLTQKVAALVAQTAILAAAVGAFVAVGRWFQLTISPAHVAGITATTFLLGVDFGLLALAVGAATGRRGLTLGVTTAVAAASYLLSSLAPVVAWIRPARFASLLYWSVGDEQLATGATLVDFAVLVAVGCALLAAAVAAFRRLDLH